MYAPFDSGCLFEGEVWSRRVKAFTSQGVPMPRVLVTQFKAAQKRVVELQVCGSSWLISKRRIRKRLRKWSVLTRQANAKTPRNSSGPDKKDSSRVSRAARARRENKDSFRTLDSFAVNARVAEATKYSATMVTTNFGRHDIVAADAVKNNLVMTLRYVPQVERCIALRA